MTTSGPLLLSTYNAATQQLLTRHAQPVSNEQPTHACDTLSIIMHVHSEAVFMTQGQARTGAVPGHPGACHAITIILAGETYMNCLAAIMDFSPSWQMALKHIKLYLLHA